MNRPLALALLIAGFVAATSPVWAAPLDTGLTFDPDPAYPGQTVDFSGALGSAETGDGTCTAGHFGTPSVAASSCSFFPASAVTGYVVIPTDAPIGTPYRIDVCADGCGGEFGWGRNGAVKIVAPSATVPTLHCATYGEAVERLTDRGLNIVRTFFPWPIGRVAPSGGSVVSSGSTVTPYPAKVPTLSGLPYPAASSAVVYACATPVLTGPADGAVASQSPAPGQAVPSEQIVLVYLTPNSSPDSSPPTSPTSTAPTSPSTSGGKSDREDDDGDHPPHHRSWWKRVALPTGGAAGLAALVFLGMRRWHIVHTRPLVDPATLAFEITQEASTSDITEGARGQLSASYVTVRQDHPPTVEENP